MLRLAAHLRCLAPARRFIPLLAVALFVAPPLAAETKPETGAVRLVFELPGVLGPEIAVDVVSLGPTREKMPDGSSVEVAETAKYDALGRTMEHSDALGNTWHTTWDARSRARMTMDPEGAMTVRTFDGLDRLVMQQRPERIVEHWTYDESSRLLSYADAKSQTTRFSYDPLDRQTEILWPDSTKKTFAYDAAHNVREIRDANGNVIVQEHDAANRLLVRTITPAAGVVGPTSETYSYDGLRRLTSTTSGGQTAGFYYDSLSRVVKETQNGRAVESTFDDAGNRAELLYPSGLKIGTHFDDLDRPLSVMRMGATETPVASYGYRGRDLLAERNVGGLTGHMAFDGARRLTTTTYKDLASAMAFGENLGWNKRNQITSQLRGDLNEAGKVYRYDDAGRIIQALAVHGEPPADLTALDCENFRYDTADNLVERSTKTLGLEEKIALPTDRSGRNRPASFHGIPLSWDANGNLTDKGDLHFEYDYRNRLSRVTHTGHEVATYGYDAFNRRVEKSVEGNTQKTSWSGWQALEKFENGQATERRIYGNGIDELVQLEKVEAGTSLTYAPVYDAKGNLALLTDTNGKTVERTETSTYGQTIWFADSTPPAITQLRLRNGAIEIRTSEEVRLAGLQAALTSGKATLIETETNHAIPFLATQPPSAIQGTQQTRLVLMPSAAISANTGFRLRLEPAAIQDLFGNPLSAPFEQTLTWDQAADTVLADTAPPEVSHVLLRGTSLEIGFTEPLVGANVVAAILIDGQSKTWAPTGDGETWTTADLADGDHALAIATTPLDLAGKPLDEAFERAFHIELSHPGLIVYRRPDPSELPTSATGTALTFQGLELDSETGLLYVRNRYFDPELGRFITADPMGYPDGPSGYAFGAGDAVNGRDPMGLRAANAEDRAYLRKLLEFEAELSHEYRKSKTHQGRRITAKQYARFRQELSAARGSFSQAVMEANDTQAILQGSDFFTMLPQFWPEPTEHEKAVATAWVLATKTAPDIATLLLAGRAAEGEVPPEAFKPEIVEFEPGDVEIEPIDVHLELTLEADALETPPRINWGKQEKHIQGCNNYVTGRSILRANPERLATWAGTGEPANNVLRREPGFKERIDFGEVIGDFVENGVETPTTKGIIIYAGDGSIHIVPSRP